MKDNLTEILEKYSKLIEEAADLKVLDELFLKLFGKTGEISVFARQFSTIDKSELKEIQPLFNKVKNQLDQAITLKREATREEFYKSLTSEKLDISGAKLKSRTGHMHPITQFENQIVDIFSKLGFERYDAPQIDTDQNNFEVLNIPEEHPARDLWDTLYIDTPLKGPNPQKLLLRTHTSNSQVRIMKEFKPPVRKMIIGRCFRYENLDARHEHTFEQFEIVYIDKGLSMANLQYLSEYFFKHIFGQDIKARLKPKYYPFVEPGAGVDGLCIFCKGKGCKVCGGLGWLELAGAGMIHPQVLKNGGIDPNEYSGIAWGMGPARMAMLKWGIDDVRFLNSGDLSFLNKF